MATPVIDAALLAQVTTLAGNLLVQAGIATKCGFSYAAVARQLAHDCAAHAYLYETTGDYGHVDKARLTADACSDYVQAYQTK